jgi:competence protein ComEC
VTNQAALLLRQRLPFLYLLGFAIIGILLGRYLPFSSTPWIALALISAAIFIRWRGALVVLGISLFACLQIWQTRESPAAILANWLEAEPVPAEAYGLVASEPRVFESGSASFDLQLSTLSAGGKTFSPNITVLAEWPGPPPALGDEVRIAGELQNIEPPRNPGQFDFAAWSRLRQIYSRVTAKDGREAIVLHKEQAFALQRAALASREWMHHAMVQGIDDPAVSDLIVAMVLGDTSALPDAVQEQFRGTGTYHLFSVSGLHVGMLAVLLFPLLRVFRLTRRQAAFLIIPALFFYVFMTGWKAASIRAAIMTSVVLFGLIANRQPILFNNLCAAAFLILLGDTNQLFNAGFQFSFCVVAAIFLGAKPIGGFLEKPFLHDPFLPEKLIPPFQRYAFLKGRKFAELSAVSIAAWAGSLPLTLGYFNLISFSALPANLFAIPISFGIMAVAMLSLLAAPASAWVSEVFNQTNCLLTKLLLWVISAFSALPGSYVYVNPSLPPRPVAEIVVFDFGDGGASWLSIDGKTWMFDCGPGLHFDTTILPFVRSRGQQSSLDGLLLTHGDASHIGSGPKLIETLPPKRVLDSTQYDRSQIRETIKLLLLEKNILRTRHSAGDTVSISKDANLHILYPPHELNSKKADDEVLIVRLDIEGLRILFLSDATLAAEQWLLEHSPKELRCDILVRGRPFMGHSGDAKLLAAAQPHALITAATGFAPGRKLPPEFVKGLASKGMTLFPQDETGAVTIRIFSSHWEASAFIGNRKYSNQR